MTQQEQRVLVVGLDEKSNMTLISDPLPTVETAKEWVETNLTRAPLQKETTWTQVVVMTVERRVPFGWAPVKLLVGNVKLDRSVYNPEAREVGLVGRVEWEVEEECK